MRDLENEIARLQLCAEELLSHLQRIPFHSREASATRRNLGRMARKLVALERKYDAQFKVVFDAIRRLMTPSQPPTKRRAGFASWEDD